MNFSPRTFEPAILQQGSVCVLRREDLAHEPHWRRAFADQRKDHRYYELIEDTLPQNFHYRYFAIRDGAGEVRAVAPFFLLDQDLLAGMPRPVRNAAAAMRRLFPRFMVMRTLMVGCSAGEGHIDATDCAPADYARILSENLLPHAETMGASLIVLKEFPAADREALAQFCTHGFTRAPSFPMVALNIDYASFEDYMVQALSGRSRRDLRQKFRTAEAAAPIVLSVVTDASDVIDEIYPLYLQVFSRSKHQFEKLTKEYFCELGRRMPDKTRFFVWRQNGRAVAMAMAMLHGDSIYAEYIGLDYRVALDLHLYHYVVRDVVRWAMQRGYKWFRSSGLNYEPKYHLRAALDPVDLYVRHRSNVLNPILRFALPLLEPTRYDPMLKRFANFAELHGGAPAPVPKMASGPRPERLKAKPQRSTLPWPSHSDVRSGTASAAPPKRRTRRRRRTARSG